MSDTVEIIQEKLTGQYPKAEIKITDFSAQHAGHPEAVKSGGGHFQVDIKDEAFTGVGKLQRQKAIYKILGDLIPSPIHALIIKASSPEDS